jgi:hypothetical protein
MNPISIELLVTPGAVAADPCAEEGVVAPMLEPVVAPLLDPAGAAVVADEVGFELLLQAATSIDSPATATMDNFGSRIPLPLGGVASTAPSD